MRNIVTRQVTFANSVPYLEKAAGSASPTTVNSNDKTFKSPAGQIGLMAHSCLVKFRNIWVRNLPILQPMRSASLLNDKTSSTKGENDG